MKRRPPPPKDPQEEHDLLLRKTEELREMKKRLAELEAENRKVKTAAHRLEKLAKRDGSAPLDSSAPGSVLNPRDAQQAASLIDDQKRLLDEKERMIRSLLAGQRMENIGGRKVAPSPAAIYGINRPARKTPTTVRSASATRKMTASASARGLHSSRNAAPPPLDIDQDEAEEPHLQPAASSAHPTAPSTPLRSPSRSASARNLSSPRASPQPFSSPRGAGAPPTAAPTPAANNAAGTSSSLADESHYLEFNRRLQERINSTQNLHRSAMAAGGDGGASGSDPSSSPPGGGGGLSSSIGRSAFADDDGFPPEGDPNELVAIRRELRQKKAKIAALQSHFEHLTVSFRVEKDLQKITLAQCEELKAQVASLQSKERNYQRQLEALDDHRLQLEHQATIIADLQADKKALEDRIAHLNTSLFQGDSMESMRHKQLLQEHGASVTKLQAEIEEKERAIRALKQANAALVEKSELSDRLARSQKELQADNSRLRDKCVELTEKLMVFSVDSGVEVEDLERALDIVRREREAPPSRVSFLHGDGKGGEEGAGAAQQPESVSSLRRKLSELEIKSRDYLLEIQQKSDMLNVQYALNKDVKRQLADERRRAQDLQQEVDRLKHELAHRPMGSGVDAMSDSMFAMSDVGSDGAALEAEQLTGLENLIAFRVLSASLDPQAACFATLNGSSPITFLCADFYEFESSLSEPFGGFNPQFRFTTQYAVDTDSFLLQYLEREELVLTLYQQTRGTDNRKIAVCYIPLRGLLSPSAAVEGRAQLLHVADRAAEHSSVRGLLRDGGDMDADDETDGGEKKRASRDPTAVIGEIHYVLRMKRPILSAPPSLSPSQPGTPAQRSRQGSIAGLTHAQQQYGGASTANTLSLHHANRDIGGAAAMQPPRSTFQHQSSVTDPFGSSRTFNRGSIGAQPAHSPPSSYAAPSFYARSQQSQLGRMPSAQQHFLDEFNQPSHPSQQHAQRGQEQAASASFEPAGGSSRQLRPNPTRVPSSSTLSVAGNPGGASAGHSRQGSAGLAQRGGGGGGWEDELRDEPQRRPSASALGGTHAAFTVEQPSGSLPASSRSSFSAGVSAARRAEHEEKAIADLLNNPDEQDALFGNDQNTDRQRHAEEEF